MDSILEAKASAETVAENVKKWPGACACGCKPVEEPQPTLTAFGTTDYGRVAFEEYKRFKEGVTYDNRPIPVWDDLGQTIQDAWRAGAWAVVRQMVQDNAAWGGVFREVKA